MPDYPSMPQSNIPHETSEDVYVSDDSKDFSRWHLSPEEMIEELEHDLKGEAWKNNKWCVIGKRLLNDEGIGEIISLVRGHVNKFVFLAKFQEDDIMDIMRHLDEALIDLISMKYKDFDIELCDFDVIRSIVVTICYASLTRGLGGWTMDSVGKVVKTRENIIPMDQQKKGLLSGFFGR